MDKEWMRKDTLSLEYEIGIESFLQFAMSNANDPNAIPCPCARCDEHASFAEEPIDMVHAVYDSYAENPSQFNKLLEDAEKSLYPGCTKFTKLSAIVKLFNLKAKYGWSDNSFTDLLSLFREILPDDNELPSSLYDAKKSLRALGMEYVKIHACPNDCILYRKEYEDLANCPTCGTSRWKLSNKSKVKEGFPAKVLWYFPPIPRFQKMFRDKTVSKELTWHSDKRIRDGYLRHPADAPSWKLVDRMWPDFASETRNLRLAISADGINPHSLMSSSYSCWPILMITYNLPPWLCMKRKFVMLTLLISGPRQPGNDIDVYLAPLVDDLKCLWDKGVEACDAYRQESFSLRAVLLWTINDFPAYGNISGCVVKGYYACPICAEKTYSTRLKNCRKMSYMGHRRFLPSNHPYRRQKKAFNGNQEFNTAPRPLSGHEVLERVERINYRMGKFSGKLQSKMGDGEQCWKKKSIFFELEYWKHLHVRHVLDVMHIEKNVCESVIGTLLDISGKTKDGVAARLDLMEMNVRSELAPRIGDKKTFLPPACYTLSKDEKRSICNSLSGMKVPEGYSSNVKNLVSIKDLKLVGLKSHDLLDNWLHLVREVKLCGPVWSRHMYPFERYMKILKGYVRNRNRPEGCIAECYIAEEAVEFFSDYLSNVHTIGIPSRDREVQRTKPLSKAIVHSASHNELQQAHLYVLTNDIEIDPYIEEHMVELRTRFPHKAKSKKWLQDEHNRTFITWLYDFVERAIDHSTHQISERLKWISRGPRKKVLKYSGYLIDGVTYATKERDDVRVTQNSRVSLVAKTMQVSSAKDKNPIMADMVFYGIIEEIWSLDYHNFQIPMFKCHWVENNNGIKVDDLGFTLVNLNRIGFKLESFILGSQAKKVFFVEDPEDPLWSIVLAAPTRESFENANGDELEDIVIHYESSTRGLPSMEVDDEDDNDPQCLREDCDGTWIDN
ncbi:uncharacterized protein [Henckelia pumila]|uniref:uncharacterized protein n=1 Tax=Henckelia pumila TaxID=405737 RepID=UPI003C6E42AC